MATVFELLITPKFEKVRQGGVVGFGENNTLAVLTYPQPKDAQFDSVRATVVTRRKVHNRQYRKNRSGRGISSVGKGVDKRTLVSDETKGEGKTA